MKKRDLFKLRKPRKVKVADSLSEVWDQHKKIHDADSELEKHLIRQRNKQKK